MWNRRFQNVFDFWDTHHGYANEEVLSSLKIQVHKMQLFTYPEHKLCGKFCVCIAGENFVTRLRTISLASTQDVI